jgi:hypothetical protein
MTNDAALPPTVSDDDLVALLRLARQVIAGTGHSFPALLAGIDAALAARAGQEQRPVAYLYQHDETARTTLRTADDRMADQYVREGRWWEVPLYAHPPALPAQAREAMKRAIATLRRCGTCDGDGMPVDDDRYEVIDALRAALGDR